MRHHVIGSDEKGRKLRQLGTFRKYAPSLTRQCQGKANTTGLLQTYAQCDTLCELNRSPRSVYFSATTFIRSRNSAAGEEIDTGHISKL